MKYRVYLRALEPEDYKTSIKWRQNNLIWQNVGGVKYYVSESCEKQWVEKAIADSTAIRLAVCLKENDTYIGNVYITDINPHFRSGNSQVLIGDTDYWGQGYAREAYLQLLDYAFNERGLHRVFAHILEDNIASIKMHSKCGFKTEGVLRESVFKQGVCKNQVLMSILDHEFRELMEQET